MDMQRNDSLNKRLENEWKNGKKEITEGSMNERWDEIIDGKNSE